MNDWDIAEHRFIVADGCAPYGPEKGAPSLVDADFRRDWTGHIELTLHNGQIIRVKHRK